MDYTPESIISNTIETFDIFVNQPVQNAFIRNISIIASYFRVFSALSMGFRPRFGHVHTIVQESDGHIRQQLLSDR